MRPAIRSSPALLAAGLLLLAGSCRRGGHGGASGPATGSVRITVPSDSDVNFTAHAGENAIPLRAVLSGSAAGGTVTWEVTPEPGSAGVGLPPPVVAPGESTSLRIVAPSEERWSRLPHPATPDQRARQLDVKSLAYRVVAVAKRGSEEWRSDTVVIRQSEASTVREEYLDLKVPQGVPAAASLVRQPPGADALEPNSGDYGYAVRNAAFDALFTRLKQSWLSVHPAGQWQVNSGYRNPVHNQFHVGKGVGSGSVSASWHQYGCAADLQTFPVMRTTQAQQSEALNFWHALADEATFLGFDVEPLQSANGSYSGVAHVHVEKDCPQ